MKPPKNKKSPKLLFNEALAISVGQEYCITCEDRKTFSSLRARFYEIKRNLSDLTIDISTCFPDIILTKTDPITTHDDNSLNHKITTSIRTKQSQSQEQQTETPKELLTEEDTHFFNSISEKKEVKEKKLKPGEEEILKLVSEKEKVQKLFSSIAIKIGKTAATEQTLDKNSELYNLDSRSKELQSIIKKLRILYKIPEIIPQGTIEELMEQEKRLEETERNDIKMCE